MSYYGLSLNSVNLPGSVYDNLAFVALAELVGYLACFMCFISGRKWTHAVSMSIGGLALMSPVLIHYYFEGKDHAYDLSPSRRTCVPTISHTCGGF